MAIHALLAALAVFLCESSIIQVLFLQNTLQKDDWKEGFDLFFNSYLDQTGFVVSDSIFRLNVTHCAEPLDASSEVDAMPRIQRCIAMARDGFDVIVVGSSSYNQQIKSLAEVEGIPNLHCSGSHPLSWTSAMPHAFGLQLPVTLYSQQVIRQAAYHQLKSVVMIRNFDDEFQRLAAVGSSEWIRESGLHVIGPTESWCTQWSHQTRSCSLRNNDCRCGSQSEFDDLGYKYDDSRGSFYEVSEDLLEPSGLVAFVEGIIQDVRLQTHDPDLVLNFLSSPESGLLAMKHTRFNSQMYYGSDLSEDSNISRADTMYHLASGQWHSQLRFTDPIFGSSQDLVASYKSQFGKVPSDDSAACVAAGVALVYSLQKSDESLQSLTTAQRRERIQSKLNDETFFGRIHFDRNNLNVGRLPITWQILEEESRPVLPPELVVDRLRWQSPSWDVRLGCPPGSYAAAANGAAMECKLCKEGTFRSSSTAPLEVSQCEQCPRGRGSLPGQTGLVECPWCPAGRFQNGDSDGGVCNQCALGSSRSLNSSSCEPCEAHSFADVRGLDACKPCGAGSSQPEVGSASCVCDVGYYASSGGCSACELVLPGGTTLYPNSKKSEDCICPPGRYWHRPTAGSPLAYCKECHEGLLCPGGFSHEGMHQAPLQSRGFSSSAPEYVGAQPDYVISCSDNWRCPGNLPLGECPANSMGIACTQCAPGYFSGNKGCESCSEPFDVVSMSIALCFMLVAFCGFCVFATRMDKSHRDSLFMILASAGLIFMSVNALPIFSKLDVQLVEPLRSLRLILVFLTLDFDVLRPDCYMGSGEANAVFGFLGAMLLYPCGSVFLLFVFAIGKFCLKKDLTWYEVKYAHGVLVLALYILMTSLTMRPFRCVLNPDGSSSLGYHRDVICWRDDTHFWMVALSFLPFFGVVVSFAALIVTMVVRYPQRLGRQGGAKFVKRWSFVFGHFVPKRYYFALIFTLRNFLVGVLPAIFTSQQSLLILSITFTMCLYGFVQVSMRPWKTLLANYIDAGLSLLTVMVMILATTLLDFDVNRELLLIQILSMILAALIFLGATVALVVSLYKTYKPTRTYGIFLSHHKLGAGALARWFKMMMSEFIKDKIFLDSDDVNKLDAIMDVTAYDSDNVLVLMTSETLKRMWCAAEISCAWHAGTNIVLVSCDGNRISDELMAFLPDLWNEEQEATLLNAGVTIQMIDNSYRALQAQELIALDRHGAVERAHRAAVQQVLSRCRGLTKRKFASSRYTISGRRMSADGLAPLMMLSDLRTPEVGCCARVITCLLRNQLQEDICLYDPYDVVDDLQNFKQEMEGAAAVLVLLTQGMLQDYSFAGIMANCPESSRENLVPIRADESFVYPDPGFWEQLAEGRVFNGQTLAEMETDPEGVRVAYAKLFNVLALKFSQHGSEHIQKTEIVMMGERLLPMLSLAAPERHNSRGSARRSDAPVGRVGTSTSTKTTASRDVSLLLGPPEQLDLPLERDPVGANISNFPVSSFATCSFDVAAEVVREEF